MGHWLSNIDVRKRVIGKRAKARDREASSCANASGQWDQVPRWSRFDCSPRESRAARATWEVFKIHRLFRPSSWANLLQTLQLHCAHL